MENKRENLAEQLEMIGELFEIEQITPLLMRYKNGMSGQQFNALTLQVCSVVMKQNKGLCDRLIAKNKNIDLDAVQELDDAEYSLAMREAITKDVLGFFG